MKQMTQAGVIHHAPSCTATAHRPVRRKQREAKRNLIVSLVTGLAANTAAGAAVDNNWLATQQIVAFKKEYNAADGLIAKAQVTGKWAYISSKQDVLTQFGIGKGLAQSGWSDVTGLAEFIAHPIDGLKGLKALVSDPKAREQFGDAFVTELNAKIDDITKAVETGGDDNAVVLGQRIGEIAWQVGSVVTGVGGAAKGGVALAKAGIKVGAQQLEKMAEVARIERLAAKVAKDPNPMSSVTDFETTVLPERNVLEAKPTPADPPSPQTADFATGLLNTQLAKDIKAYLTDIQNLTGRQFTPQQLELLKADLRENVYSRLSKEEADLNRIDFERKLPSLRKEWEANTGQTWPKETYTDRNGNVKNRNYDAHHVVENKFGGKAEWWNITPAMRGFEHQGGIHRAQGPAETLFGR